MDNARFEWKMQGLGVKNKVWIENTLLEGKIQGSNGKKQGLNWKCKFEWKIQGLIEKCKVWMENTRFKWKIQGLNG